MILKIFFAKFSKTAWFYNNLAKKGVHCLEVGGIVGITGSVAFRANVGIRIHLPNTEIYMDITNLPYNT